MEITLHKSQDKVFDSKARFIGVVAGIRGGKTTVGALWLLNEIQKHRDQGKLGDYLITAPTHKILEQSTLPKFKEFFPTDWGVWKEQKGYFELAWEREGSQEPCRIFVRSLDDPDSIEGMECLAAWVDECGKIRHQGWINVQGRLSVTQGRAILTTTPYAVNWFYSEIMKRAKQDDPNYETIVWSSVDNPAFPKEEYDRAKATLPKAIFERRYEGKFTRLEGLVYPEFDEDDHIVNPFPIPESWVRFGGLDFGKSNPNAIVCIAEDPDNKIFYVYKEFYKNETLLQTISNFLHNENLSYVLADTQAAQNIMELQRFYGNKNVKEADKVKDTGVFRIRQLLSENRLKFFKGHCTHTIEEILEYHYAAPDSDGFNNDKIVDRKNHAMDALRYAFSRVIHGLYRGYSGAARDKKYKKISRNFRVIDPITGY
jgi:PBSX family phage terminase large subunit